MGASATFPRSVPIKKKLWLAVEDICDPYLKGNYFKEWRRDERLGIRDRARQDHLLRPHRLHVLQQEAQEQAAAADGAARVGGALHDPAQVERRQVGGQRRRR